MIFNEVELTKIDLDHLYELREMSISTYRDAFGKYNTKENMNAYLDTAFGKEVLMKELSNTASEFFFARYKNLTLGYLKLNTGDAQTDFRKPDGMELERIYVLKKYQKKKIGQVLMNFVIERAKEKGVSYLWLGVWEKNLKAIEFYKRNGFQVIDTHPFGMGTDIQTDFIMRLKLKD